MASIRKINGKNGDSYKITVTTGRDASGKQIRHYKTWKPENGMTARQIDRELQRVAYEFERDIELGYRIDDNQTFEEYAMYCLQLREQRGDRPQTIARARAQYKRIFEYIGHLKLNEIRPQHLNAVYRELMKPGSARISALAYPVVNFREIIPDGETYEEFAKRCGVARGVVQKLCNGKYCTERTADKISQTLGRTDIFRIEKNFSSLSVNTVWSYHEIITSTLEQAEHEMIIKYNPAKNATPPKKKRPERQVMQPDELTKFVEALANENIKTRTLFTLFSVTGCRRGEILGLKWENIDFEKKRIFICVSLNYTSSLGKFEGKTKTGNERYVPLSASMARMLIEYKGWQNIERNRLGDMWKDSGYVFCDSVGGALHPTSVNVMLTDLCKKYNLKKIHPHTFRHTAASIMISRGVDVLTVAKMLGHADTSTTLDIYAHEIYEAKEAAAECVSDVILGCQHKMA